MDAPITTSSHTHVGTAPPGYHDKWVTHTVHWHGFASLPLDSGMPSPIPLYAKTLTYQSWTDVNPGRVIEYDARPTTTWLLPFVLLLIITSGVYTDSDYVWKIVKSKARLLEIGSSSSSQEMLTRYFDEVNYSVNVDILYPLVRSFSRLNGRIESATTTQKEFINTKVEFVHSMDGVTSIRGGLTYVRTAMGQYYRERVS